ncbi:glycosyltransferase family 2 protein [Desulfurispirillum indicum]|uniref:glycosyltransferase family 2 protein n=1 Tax=Desulfurispirillum indicum TaxID=936456 RepID=UPI001CFA27C7|nr:glycosyltransferase family 2 protein [Desulfurispirillum indicum]UCZ56948.1 glycosyltransferase family 2 protein [Desulfurispirillum indicum]
MKISVIFTTYNSPAWLEKVLWGFFEQTVKDFEIVIADDGSRDETRELIERMRVESPVPIKHIWQEDDGFQKCRILNKAIVAAEGEYAIFTDGDCIPRNDFVAQHLRFARRDRYLSGGYFKLPLDVSHAITREDIVSQRAFDVGWLASQGFMHTHKSLKLIAKGWFADVLNVLSPTRPTWNGHSASCHREHIIAVNGFDENMQYGGQDCEFGDRLLNYGLKAQRIRYSAVCLHLDHGRGYATEETRAKNRRIREHTKKHKVVRSPLGLDQYLPKGD